MRRNEWDNKPGVYKMTNIESGNFYIGSTINIKQRIKTHKQCLRRGYTCFKGSIINTRIAKDVETYGCSSFKFEVLEYCEKSVMKDREQYYFEVQNPFYNIWPTVYNAEGRSYTPAQLQSFAGRTNHIKDIETFREKLKAAWNRRKLDPNYKETIKQLDRTGRLHTDEAKKKMSSSGKGRPKSEETKRKMSQARLGFKFDRENNIWIKPN